MARAKTRSRTPSSTKKPPEFASLFLDANADGKKLAEALRGMGIEVHLCRDHFPHQTKDEDLLAAIAEKGWIFVTKDGGIRRRETEREAIRRHKLTAIIFKSAELTGQEMADAFGLGARRLYKLIRSARPPLIALLGKNGEVEKYEGPRWK